VLKLPEFNNAIESLEKCDLKDEDYIELKNELYVVAVKYAQLRVEWFLSNEKKRLEIDIERTRTHDALISACDSLSRYMAKRGANSSWRKIIGTDRREIGDFACYLHYWLGIKAR